MKDIFLILFTIGGLGAAAWALKFEKPRLEAEVQVQRESVAELKAELKDLKKELTSAKKAAEKSKVSVAVNTPEDSQPSEVKARPPKPNSDPETAASSPPDSPAEKTQGDMLSELGKWRTSATAENTKKRKILDRNEVAASKALKAAKLALEAKSEEIGGETVSVVDSNGRVRERAVGTRMADADQEKVLAPFKVEVQKQEQMLKAIASARTELATELSGINEHFREQLNVIQNK